MVTFGYIKIPPVRFCCFYLLFFSGFFTAAQVVETTRDLHVDESRSTVRTRFSPPEGYVWNPEMPGSFSDFLVHFPLHPAGFPVRDYRGVPIEKQNHHAALLKIDVGEQDLQQCADAWIRMYAEYLWGSKRSDDVAFEFTSGQLFRWTDYKNGMRTREVKKRVNFISTSIKDDSYQNFREYLKVIFRYAGTISLDKESLPVTQNQNIKPGDFIITPGSPGHSVIVMGVARNTAGKRLYLLAESFMPAQDIHILVNPRNPGISPWYELDVNSPVTVTAKYTFKPTVIKRFHSLW